MAFSVGALYNPATLSPASRKWLRNKAKLETVPSWSGAQCEVLDERRQADSPHQNERHASACAMEDASGLAGPLHWTELERGGGDLRAAGCTAAGITGSPRTSRGDVDRRCRVLGARGQMACGVGVAWGRCRHLGESRHGGACLRGMGLGQRRADARRVLYRRGREARGRGGTACRGVPVVAARAARTACGIRGDIFGVLDRARGLVAGIGEDAATEEPARVRRGRRAALEMR